MKYFVTGGTGSIGFGLVKKLSELGHEVHVLVRDLNSATFLNFKGVSLHAGDVTDFESMRKPMQNSDGVYHLAALAKVWDKDPDRFEQVNFIGTQNVLNMAIESKVSKVVFCSSAGTFGPSINGIVNEETTRSISLFNLYESTKMAAEQLTIKYSKNGLNAVVVSPTRVFGPVYFRKPDSLFLLIQKFINKGWRIIPGNGKQIGNYVFIDDVVNGHILAMEKGVNGEIYILGGHNLTYDAFFHELAKAAGIRRVMIHIPIPIIKLLTYLQMFRTLFGKEPLLTPDWTAKVKLNWEVDVQKAVSDLDYSITPLSKALKITAEFYKKDWSNS